MSSDFNPYREWLSIPLSEQPANYYRLLGVPLFESDTDVISNAADRQMTFIRTFQMGKYAQQSQQILNELSAARITLLDKQKKAEYDAKLRAKQISRAHQSPSNNNPVDSLLTSKNGKKHSPPSTPSHTPPVPSHTPLLTPSLTLSVPSITPPPLTSRTPAVLSITPPPPIPQTPPIPSVKTPSAHSPVPPVPSQRPSSTPPRAPSSNKKDVPPPLPSRRSKSIQQSSESKTSFFKKRWIAISISILVIPLILFGSGLLLNHHKPSSQENHSQEKPQVFEHDLKPGDRKTIEINGVEFAFRWCPPGTFMMGSPEDEEGRKDNEKQHEVTLSKGFWMLETEVSQKQWQAIMGENPSSFVGEDLPVDDVSWDGCQNFFKKCAELGFQFQLPTEAQWEYACRAGTTGAYSGNLDKMAWYGYDDCGEVTHSCGTKTPNCWGLYDMHGNAEEWCQDWYSKEYPGESVTDPTGPSSGDERVIRGGGWRDGPWGCRSAYRDCSYVEYEIDHLSFRFISSMNLESAKPGEIESYEEKEKTAESADDKKETKPVVAKEYFHSGKSAGDRIVRVVNGVEFAFCWCPPGDFMMGAPKSEPGRNYDEKQHKVTLTKGFWMMETEVTQKQWQAVMGNNPSRFRGDDFPVNFVTWYDCQEFCEKCAELGLPVQLPTEAQWEYACRAGTTGAFAGALDEIAWYEKNSGNEFHPVGTKKSNAWGLYDMHGSVWEWCADRYDSYPDRSLTNPSGPSKSPYRVSRSGSCYNDTKRCRSAQRDSSPPVQRIGIRGFRCVSPIKR